MGFISKYAILYDGVGFRQPIALKDPTEAEKGRPILTDAKEITLAEYDVDTKDAITAHHLKDYRRRRFNLVLLPKIDVPFDRMLEGSEYWNGLLHYESAYS